MSQSKIENLICSKDFPYLSPYFYSNPYALRCELGIGKDHEAYMASARQRALEIYRHLFPDGADAILFNYWITDFSCGDKEDYVIPDEGAEDCRRFTVEMEAENLRFLLECQDKYRYVVVRDLPTYDAPDDEDFGQTRRNRIVCYSNGKGFDYEDLIDRQLGEIRGHEIGLVSFRNECILSVYDSRGCDVCFATLEKYKEFYPILRPYFLEYDLAEMERRFHL